MLGYPEQAVRMSDAAHAHARRRGHPFDLGWALTVGAQVFDYLREPDELLKRAEEAERAGSRKQPALPDGVLAPSLVRHCIDPEGPNRRRDGFAREGPRRLGGRAVVESGSPYWKSVLAEGMAQLGDLDGALDLIDEVIAQIERPGWEERYTTPKSSASRAGCSR